MAESVLAFTYPEEEEVVYEQEEEEDSIALLTDMNDKDTLQEAESLVSEDHVSEKKKEQKVRNSDDTKKENISIDDLLV
jgi:hypothetical protein